MKLKKDVFLWFGIATMFIALFILSSYTISINISTAEMMPFIGIMILPISMASFAAGILEGSRDKIFMIFFIYLIFFGMVFLTPVLINL
jgi:tellurite resistance protein TehA-like permease